MYEEQVFYFFYKTYRELCALEMMKYLDSALVWHKAHHALWTYNELVLTNHGARISLNIL